MYKRNMASPISRRRRLKKVLKRSAELKNEWYINIYTATTNLRERNGSTLTSLLNLSKQYGNLKVIIVVELNKRLQNYFKTGSQI